MGLNQLNILDYSDRIAALRKHSGHSVLPLRSGENYITFHYSGVEYDNRSEPVELQCIINEAAYQLSHNYGTPRDPAYPDGMLYDFVVLSSGRIVRTRKTRQQLWHAGNRIANTTSWSIHTMLGGKQDVTPAQRAGLFSLFDALRIDRAIPRENVIAHCEWPRVDGSPIRASSYRLLPAQSQCPGATLFASVVLAYRAVKPATVDYKVKPGWGTLRSEPRRTMANIVRNVPIGTVLQVTKSVDGETVLGNTTWYQTDKGLYIHSSAVEKM